MSVVVIAELLVHPDRTTGYCGTYAIMNVESRAVVVRDTATSSFDLILSGVDQGEEWKSLATWKMYKTEEGSYYFESYGSPVQYIGTMKPSQNASDDYLVLRTSLTRVKWTLANGGREGNYKIFSAENKGWEVKTDQTDLRSNEIVVKKLGTSSPSNGWLFAKVESPGAPN